MACFLYIFGFEIVPERLYCHRPDFELLVHIAARIEQKGTVRTELHRIGNHLLHIAFYEGPSALYFASITATGCPVAAENRAMSKRNESRSVPFSRV